MCRSYASLCYLVLFIYHLREVVSHATFVCVCDLSQSHLATSFLTRPQRSWV